MKVSVICVADRPDRLPCLYWSLVAQTYKDWELIVMDQTDTYDDSVTYNIPIDHRVGIHMPPCLKVHRYGDWGQTAKEKAAAGLARGDVLMFPADDSYYVPTALSVMLNCIVSLNADLVVCGWIYDHLGYRAMPPCIAEGYVDVGGFMVRRETFLKVGWRDKGQTGDYTLLSDIVESGATVAYEPSILYVKN